MKPSEMLRLISQMPLGEERGLVAFNDFLDGLTLDEKAKLKATATFLVEAVESTK